MKKEQRIMRYVHSCWFSSLEAYNLYVNMDEDGEMHRENHTAIHKQSSLVYLSQAHTFAQVGNLFYLQNFEELELQWFEDFVVKFNRLNDEFLDSYSTDHSVQHTMIYFDDFKEAYNLVKEYFPQQPLKP